jgi:hypothetical protein
MNLSVHIDNLGDIPPRTALQVLVPTLNLKDGDVLDGQELDIEYECIDCGFKTLSLTGMKEHQKNQKKYHTWWQRIRRWWTIP